MSSMCYLLDLALQYNLSLNLDSLETCKIALVTCAEGVVIVAG